MFFLLTLTLRNNNWRVCSAGNIPKKKVSILVYAPYLYYQKNVKKGFFPQLLSGFGRLSINAFQMHRTHVLTTSTEKITIKTHFYMILHQFNAKNVGVFSLFFQYFHLYFIGNQLFPKVMTSVNMSFFSPNSILIPQKNILKSNQNQWICDG